MEGFITFAEDYFKWRRGARVARKRRVTSRVSRLPGLGNGPLNEKSFVTKKYIDVHGLDADASDRGTYRITARPQFRVKLAARGGRAAAARSVAPEIVFGRGRAPSEAAPQSPCGSARAPASLSNRYLRRRRTRARRSEGTSLLHDSTVCVFRSRGGPGPRRARCPRAGRRALVVVRGAAAAGRALRPPRPVAAAPRARRGRCSLGACLRGLRERALQRYRPAADDAAARNRSAVAHWVVVGRGMRGRHTVLHGGRAGPPAPAPARRRLRRQPHALGASAGVRGHGAAGRAGGTAPASRPQAPPFDIGMGEATEVTGDGGAPAGDGGAGDARALRRRGREAGPSAQHTAARRRVRPGRTSADTSPLSARRADEKQFSTSTEQVRERRARVGGRGGRAAGPACGGRRRGRGGGRRRRWSGRQEGRAAAEGHSVVGAHGRAAAARLPARQRAAAVRDGAAPRRAVAAAAARRVTAPPLHRITLTFHYRDDQTRRSARVRVPEYYRLGDLFIWDSPPGRTACL